MKRTTKFYRKNEEEVMKSLGLEPTPNSGAGWIVKEDGQSDELICQLKSTDAQSIKVNQKDIRILEKNANIEHKLPVFAIQFLNTSEVWLMIKPEDLVDVAQYIKTGKTNSKNDFLDLDVEDNPDVVTKVERKIKSSSNARLEFNKEREKMFDKTKSAK